MGFRVHGNQDKVGYVYAPNDSPAIGSLGTLVVNVGATVTLPSHVNANDVVQDPVFLSPDRTRAKRWRYKHGVGFTAQILHYSYGNTEYVLMTTPNGSLYAYGLGDDGNFYIEPFTSGVPVNREVVMTLMHKGSLVFVADNRQPTPRKGDV
jgi:hypothetical protein